MDNYQALEIVYYMAKAYMQRKISEGSPVPQDEEAAINAIDVLLFDDDDEEEPDVEEWASDLAARWDGC